MSRPWGRDKPCFVVAEIGQNHQGDLRTAKTLIREAKKSGADCVKFQKTCIPEKFNIGALNRIYDTENSWGHTYGEHKRHLEFNDEDFTELQRFSLENDILFTASAMDEVSVDNLVDMSVPFLKIGSGDSNNVPMIEYAASKRIPLVISTGMIDKSEVIHIYNTVKKYHNEFCLMHCVSSYPTPYEDCNLNVLKDYRESFPDACIGYSGHELGISVSIAAVAMGAKMIERHVTLDKQQKGSDHKCSLLPTELGDLIVQIRIVETALGSCIKTVAPSEMKCMEKLQKSLTASGDVSEGTKLEAEHVKIKVTEPKGIDAKFYRHYIGRTLKNNITHDQPFFETDFINR